MPPSGPPAPMRRYLLAWALMIGTLVGLGCWRPCLGTRGITYGPVVVLLLSWKAASLLCLPPAAWARLTPLRLLAYCVWYGMQPQQFLAGQVRAANAPVPSLQAVGVDVLSGAAFVWLVPKVLPAATPWPVRFAIALVGCCLLLLFARLNFTAWLFHKMGFAVERPWDCPIASKSLGEFWGQRWNRIVSGLLREVLFFPLARRAGARVAMLVVFLYSGLYHEILSVLVGSGYGRPTLYFLLQYLGVAIENTRPAHRVLRGYPWLGRAWTLAVVVLPVGLFLHPRIVHELLVPLMVRAGVPHLKR